MVWREPPTPPHSPNSMIHTIPLYLTLSPGKSTRDHWPTVWLWANALLYKMGPTLVSAPQTFEAWTRRWRVLASGAKFKGALKILAIKIYNILIQSFFNFKINAKYPWWIKYQNLKTKIGSVTVLCQAVLEPETKGKSMTLILSLLKTLIFCSSKLFCNSFDFLKTLS